jgi:hypothetical protein
MISIVWFAVASAACGFAPSALFLIVIRVLQAVGAALLTPGSMAILEASFVHADRGRAIGAWSGLSGVAIAAGPLIGGYLISAAPGAGSSSSTSHRGGCRPRRTARSRIVRPGVTGKIDYAGAAGRSGVPDRHHVRAHRGPRARLVVAIRAYDDAGRRRGASRLSAP